MAGHLLDGKVDTSHVYTVDLSKPLVFQVGHLGDGYQKWVHQSIVCKESPRFFQSDFMESLTKTLWWVIPLVWMPVVFWSQVVALQRGLPLEKLFTTVPTGIFIWTFIEYFLHRFLFHVKTSSYWWNTVHYLLHGCHHKHPMDGYRLVFPPALTAVFSIIIYAVLSLFFSWRWSPSVFGGGLLGYIIYDVSHYFIHHGSPINKLTRRIKRYHLNHHFKVQSYGFGITSPIWDWVFGTLPPPLKLQSRVGLSADVTTHQ
ncbi:hypothetical protein BDL97_01G123200 [Sphagnum fallax]|nr:hypothetical protein BDL97_01G123200 [Sphagnum fallax]